MPYVLLLGKLEVVIFVRKELLELSKRFLVCGIFPPLFSGINIKARRQDHVVRLLDEFFRRVWPLDIVSALDSVIYAFVVLVNW